MKKKISITSNPKQANGTKGPLDATFVNGKAANDNVSECSENSNNEPPAVPYYKLFKFSSTTDRLFLAIAFLSAVLTGLVAPFNTLVFADLTEAMVKYEEGNHGGNVDPDFDFQDSIRLFAIRNTILGVVLLVFSYLSAMLSNYTAHNQIFIIRKRFLQAALNQDVEYYDLNDSGDFASRMTDDLTKLEDGIGEKVTTCFHYWVSFAGCLVLAFSKGWKLAFVCLASFPITLVSVGTVAAISSRLAKKESEAYGFAGSIAEEVLSGIRTVVAFGGQEKEAKRFRENLVMARDINVKRNMFTGIGLGILYFCIYSTYALSFWYGVTLVIDEPERYGVEVMVSVFFGVLMGTMNFGFSTPFFEIFGVAKGAGAKIFSVIDSEPKINPLADKGHTPAECVGNLYFKDVFFNYPSRPDVNILQGFDLGIPNGKTVAIVGSSGCGKSTVIQLVQRFYDPLSGSVFLDGNDLKDLNVNWLRSNIGVVGQEPVLFNTTIAENIRYGFEDATMKDVEIAARQANAHDFISILPKGYDTLVGERGTQLSGGQKQRIAIARALVRNPKILLLDEATSALDNNSEYKVQVALDKASQGRTTIIVAHRLSTIKTADLIVAIHEGRVVEKGTHEELMTVKGHYYNLVTAQITPAEKEEEGKPMSRQYSKQESLLSNDDEDKIVPPEANYDPDDDPFVEPNVPLSKILKLNAPEWKIVATACLCSLIMGASMPFFSVIFGNIIGTLALAQLDPDKVRHDTNIYCVLFVVIGTIIGLTTFISIYLFGLSGEKMTLRLRALTFETMLRQEIGWYDEKRNATGALCARLSGEASAVQGATGQRIGTIIQSVATLTAAIVLAMYYQWKLGLVALAFTPFTLIANLLFRNVSKSENFGTSKAMERSTKLAVEAVCNIRTVASLGREEMFLIQFSNELEPAFKKAKINTHYRGLVYGIARSIMFFAFAGSIFYGGYLIKTEGVPYEDVLKVTQALIMSTVSIANALTFAPNLQKGLQAAGRIIHLQNRKPKIVDPVNPTVEKLNAEGRVKFLNVDFSYPSRPYMKVLNGLILNVPAGKTVALVGASGCGKSTCIQLLERFYDPSSGSVRLDDIPIDELRMGEMRKNLGIVSQEPILFDRTIGENIAYGDNSRTPSQQEIIEAAKQANIHNFIISLPMGYETGLGSKGTQLSGGQKQRVAIARALLRNPKVLLLDEATSALDTESEKVVQEALDNAKMGRTCITIAHRLSTIKDADIIYVFHEGKIAESGTHSQLMDKKGIYYKLQKQSQKQTN